MAHLLPGTKICIFKNKNCLEQNKSIVTVWRTSSKNPCSFHVEIKSTLKLGNACYHSEQNFFSSNSLYRIMKIKIQRNIILPVLLFWCDIWSLSLKEEHILGSLRIGCWERYLDLREIKRLGSEEDYITRSFMICTPHQKLFVWWNHEEWDGWSTYTYAG